MELLERVARAIAEENGDDFDNLPLAKWHWTEQRGQFGGRFRDVNEPMQSSYEAMANAAIAAMREAPQEWRADISEHRRLRANAEGRDYDRDRTGHSNGCQMVRQPGR